MKRANNLEPLCAMVMLRMTHAQLLRALFADADPATEPLGSEKAAPQEDEEPVDSPTCDDDSISLDLALLEEGHLSRAGVYRLSSHISTCDTCKYVFADIVCVERRAKALDNFEDCCG